MKVLKFAVILANLRWSKTILSSIRIIVNVLKQCENFLMKGLFDFVGQNTKHNESKVCKTLMFIKIWTRNIIIYTIII